jgi:hypothetical protein
MAVITLLTDFGNDDAYAGIMKGVMLSTNPAVDIVDLTHNIDPYDRVQAAYVLDASWRFFPAGTVHVVVVDPGVGSCRAIIAVEAAGHIFLAPDNGVLSFLLDGGHVKRVVRVENGRYFLAPVSRTFHGRDIFAPVAARLAGSLDIQKLGSCIDPGQPVRLDLVRPVIKKSGDMVGTIISVDRFGNLITNIHHREMDVFCPSAQGRAMVFSVGSKKIIGLSESYQRCDAQAPLAIIGSSGYLEISVNCGSAKQVFGSQKGDFISVTC